MNSDYAVLDEHLDEYSDSTTADEIDEIEEKVIIEIDSNMFKDVVIDRKKIQITNKLKFTYYELIKWNVAYDELNLYFYDFIVVIKNDSKSIQEIVKRLSVNIVSELLETNVISSFEEGLNMYNKLSIYDNYDNNL